MRQHSRADLAHSSACAPDSTGTSLTRTTRGSMPQLASFRTRPASEPRSTSEHRTNSRLATTRSGSPTRRPTIAQRGTTFAAGQLGRSARSARPSRRCRRQRDRFRSRGPKELSVRLPPGEQLVAAYLGDRMLEFEREREVGSRSPDFYVHPPAGPFVIEVYDPYVPFPDARSGFVKLRTSSECSKSATPSRLPPCVERGSLTSAFLALETPDRRSTWLRSLPRCLENSGSSSASAPMPNRVDAKNLIRPVHAANRYSLIKPPRISFRRNCAGSGSSIGSGSTPKVPGAC